MAIYAISDLHGHLELYKQIKNFLQPKDIVYCLGDCGDRGPQSWETIKAVYNDSQFIYLKGNHEDLLINTIQEFKKNKLLGYNYNLLSWNGGASTFHSWEKETIEEQEIWLQKLLDLPLMEKYVNKNKQTIYLTHAGFTPYPVTNLTEQDLLWDRNHFFDKWDYIDSDIYIVHGHTIIAKLKSYLNETIENKQDKLNISAFFYDGGHKIDIDAGTIITKSTILLNLDTFEEYIFTIKA